MSRLALHGGAPVRKTLLPYGRQHLEPSDVRAVIDVLRSDWLTTGPAVAEFERAFSAFTGARHSVAVANGTAALHAAVYALGVVPGDEVIVPAMTFAASANCVVYQGGTPVFADVDPDTLLVDPEAVARLLSARTKAVVTVDYAGQPCDYDALLAVRSGRALPVISDSCHALGATYDGRPAGTFGTVNAFSFHPVKHITTGEGGMATTASDELAERMRTFRNHGITTDHRQRSEQGSFFYEMVDLGYNYRLTDFQSALGLSQLLGLRARVARRQAIAAQFDERFRSLSGARPLAVRPGVAHAYHLYVLRLDLDRLKADRAEIFRALRAEGLGVNVHYRPVHLHPYYRQRFGTGPGLCPVAEAAYQTLITLPLFAEMSPQDVDDVVTAVEKVLAYYRR